MPKILTGRYKRTMTREDGSIIDELYFEVRDLPDGDWLKTGFLNGLTKAECQTQTGNMFWVYELEHRAYGG